MRKRVLLDHPEQQKSDPAGSPPNRDAASLRRHYPSGSWGHRHVFRRSRKIPAVSKGADLSARLTQLPLPGVFSGQQPLIACKTYRAVWFFQA
jgi:hypothetical protein